jgi:hypothetical protein
MPAPGWMFLVKHRILVGHYSFLVGTGIRVFHLQKAVTRKYNSHNPGILGGSTWEKYDG